VARALGIRRATVHTHVKAILTKLGVHSRLEAVTLALRLGALGERSGRAPT
jgi:two-component system nitrate/nitrite response regulator NarL